MAENTKIEWCDSTLNISMGCDGCELWNRSAGINHCYAGTLTDRYGGANKGFPEKFEEPRTYFERLDKALKWKDLAGTKRPEKPWLDGHPRIIFVGDMGDTLTESLWIDTEYVRQLKLAILKMSESPHQFLFLTKRPKHLVGLSKMFPAGLPENIWPGTTVTSQSTANRCADLIRVDGGGPKFVSMEPLLGPVTLKPEWLEQLDWVILGGESGYDARPMHPQWSRNIRDQCVKAGVAFFFKQWGYWLGSTSPMERCGITTFQDDIPENLERIGQVLWDDGYQSLGVGKKAAGRLLDGREWNQFPEGGAA